eukprot:11185282-Lingulodinium_polyedra.AAC.1
MGRPPAQGRRRVLLARLAVRAVLAPASVYLCRAWELARRKGDVAAAQASVAWACHPEPDAARAHTVAV